MNGLTSRASANPKLSIIIVCWNDIEVIPECLRSIHAETKEVDFEVIVSDNGSTDSSVQFIRDTYPNVRIVENGTNLGFAKGNNAGIPLVRGEYVLFLNPDTIVLDRAFDRWMPYVEQHRDAGAFGCRVLNPDGTFQNAARPTPTAWRYLISALYLRWLGRLSDLFLSDTYEGWNGTTERDVDWVTGCCLLLPAKIVRALGGFDERFFYHFEEVDLCLRVRKAGYRILFDPEPQVIHLGGQSVSRFPIRFKLEAYRSRYRFFFKHYGERALWSIRWVSLLGLYLRRAGYGFRSWVLANEALGSRLEMYRVLVAWNLRLDPLRFILHGEEPAVGYEPLAPAPDMLDANGERGGDSPGFG
jgi:GT2 family glycosyltransferase